MDMLLVLLPVLAYFAGMAWLLITLMESEKPKEK